MLVLSPSSRVLLASQEVISAILSVKMFGFGPLAGMITLAGSACS